MNSRRILRAAGAAFALSGLASAALATGSVSSTANASATVLSPVTITKTQDLQFGQVVRPSDSNSNTVTLGADNTVTVSGPGNGSKVTSTTTSAKFTITAARDTSYTMTQALAFTEAGLTNVGASDPVAETGALGTIPVGGTQVLDYGGHFDITSGTPAQAYTGTLTVTVNYQ